MDQTTLAHQGVLYGTTPNAAEDSLLLLSFCFDVQRKTLRTKAYVTVNWGPFHIKHVLRASLVFHFGG